MGTLRLQPHVLNTRNRNRVSLTATEAVDVLRCICVKESPSQQDRIGSLYSADIANLFMV